jgi:hypothetical protein
MSLDELRGDAHPEDVEILRREVAARTGDDLNLYIISECRKKGGVLVGVE